MLFVYTLRRLKPVSTLSRDLVIRRIDTATLYHVTVMLWYHAYVVVNINYPWTRCSHSCNVTSYHGNRKALQKLPIFGFSCSYLKNGLSDPKFSLHKSDQQAKMKLSAKFKKMLWSGFRAILKFQFAESFILACWLHFWFEPPSTPSFSLWEAEPERQISHVKPWKSCPSTLRSKDLRPP